MKRITLLISGSMLMFTLLFSSCAVEVDHPHHHHHHHDEVIIEKR